MNWLLDSLAQPAWWLLGALATFLVGRAFEVYLRRGTDKILAHLPGRWATWRKRRRMAREEQIVRLNDDGRAREDAWRREIRHWCWAIYLMVSSAMMTTLRQADLDSDSMQGALVVARFFCLFGTFYDVLAAGRISAMFREAERRRQRERDVDAA